MRRKKIKQNSLWSPERHKLYERAVRSLRQQISNGHTYYQAFDTLVDLDHEMRTYIEDDFLKILIAEEHFGANIAIDDMALFLDLPVHFLESCRDSLLKDMNMESLEYFDTRKKKLH